MYEHEHYTLSLIPSFYCTWSLPPRAFLSFPSWACVCAQSSTEILIAPSILLFPSSSWRGHFSMFLARERQRRLNGGHFVFPASFSIIPFFFEIYRFVISRALQMSLFALSMIFPLIYNSLLTKFLVFHMCSGCRLNIHCHLSHSLSRQKAPILLPFLPVAIFREGRKSEREDFSYSLSWVPFVWSASLYTRISLTKAHFTTL